VSYPTTRVLALLELLQTHHSLGGRELAQRLGVDARTVRRYASRLVELGIPVEADRGRYGGYRLCPGYKLPPLMFSDSEAVAVVLGLLAGKRLGLSTAAPAVETALAKVQRVLPAALREQTMAVQETLGFTLVPREAQAPATATLLALGEAIQRRRRVLLRYRSWQGEETEREVDPYGMVFHSGRWYVTGQDHRSDALRTFRIDRIHAIEHRSGTFVVPQDFDPVAHITRSLASVPYTWEVEVLIEATLAEVRRRIPPAVANLAEADGGVLMRARAERLDGMARMLAGLEWPFVIRRPDELRTAVVTLAQHLMWSANRQS
jgi:predicted DNA-binding transcriptional regulator YafY